MDHASRCKALLEHYGSDSPFGKRLPKMSESQVFAIFMRLVEKGEIKN